MADSVLSPNADLVTVEIIVNGTAIPDAYEVRAIETEHAVNAIAWALVTIADGSRVDEGFAVSSGSIFEPGAEIDIRAGYHHRNDTIFRGVITGQTLRASVEDGSNLVVRCRDKAARLAVTQRAVQYHASRDSDNIQRILQDAGLDAEVAATAEIPPQQGRSVVSDWDYILSCADANGLLVLVRNGKVTVAPPKFESPLFNAEYGVSIMELNLSLDASGQVPEVEARAWDPRSQSVLSASSKEPSVNSQGNLTGSKLSQVLSAGTLTLSDAGARTLEMLGDRANAQLLMSRLSRFAGSVVTPGNAGLLAGTQIELSGLGKKFDGDAYITGVHHKLSTGAWRSDLQFGLAAARFADGRSDVTRSPAGNLRPDVSGLEIGVVLQSGADPEGEHRIRVSLPQRKDGDRGIWVRFASPFASDHAGIGFLPEIGDEVVVGFLGGDPDAAVILGSLHSSARPAPMIPDQENTTKSIVTRARHKVTFDDVQNSITVQTAGGHFIVMSDRDKSVTITDSASNTLEMAEGGITMTSPGDITLSADGSVTIKGVNGFDIS